MSKEKPKWTNDDTISALEETEPRDRDVKNNKIKDRPAIFIEDIHDQYQYNNSIKSN